MTKFIKKPVKVEAVQFTKDSKDEVFNFVTCNKTATHDVEGNPILQIQTLEGWHKASLGDWVIKGIKGEFYPCKPDIFDLTYEEVKQ